MELNNFLTIESALRILKSSSFVAPNVSVNNSYGFVLHARAESVCLVASYFRDGPYQSLEVEYSTPPMKLHKFNYMGKFNSPYRIEDWLTEKVSKARDLAFKPKNLPLYTVKKKTLTIKV